MSCRLNPAVYKLYKQYRILHGNNQAILVPANSKKCLYRAQQGNIKLFLALVGYAKVYKT